MPRHEIIWRILTLHCVEASRLSSESLDRDLPGPEKLAWRLHLLICGACRSHRRDLLSLRRIGRNLADSIDRPAFTLAAERQEQIKKTLRHDNTIE